MSDPVKAIPTSTGCAWDAERGVWLDVPVRVEDDMSPAEQERVLDESIRKLEARRLQLTRDVQSRVIRIEAINSTLDELTSLKLEAQNADQDERYGVPE